MLKAEGKRESSPTVEARGRMFRQRGWSVLKPLGPVAVVIHVLASVIGKGTADRTRGRDQTDQSLGQRQLCLFML